MTKTRLVETITRWAVLAGLVMPWASWHGWRPD